MAQEQLRPIEIGPFNETVAAARQSNEPWTLHPVIVGLLFVRNHSPGGQVIEHQERITLKSKPEEFRDAEVTIERSGFRDDSMAGDKYRIVLERQHDHAWMIGAAEYGWRCWEGRGHTHYSDQPCS